MPCTSRALLEAAHLTASWAYKCGFPELETVIGGLAYTANSLASLVTLPPLDLYGSCLTMKALSIA